MLKSAFIVVFSILFISPTLLVAEKNAEITPVLGKTGKANQTESFESKSLSKQWAQTRGEWVVNDGVLVGKELKSDKHAAVLTWEIPNRNSVMRCSFQLKGNQFFHVSLNHAKGHLFRVMIDETGMILRTDKNKKDPKSKPITLARAKGKIEQGKWYTLQMEMQGEKVVVQIDNGMKVEGHHPSLDVNKPNYRFILKGESFLLDDLAVWKLSE
ncbi:MAG: hypothetical protein JKY95_01230 [Planctomycetaceae bacterium]|nr:hypothetical protein [Planctomycetaceae bacterium]